MSLAYHWAQFGRCALACLRVKTSIENFALLADPFAQVCAHPKVNLFWRLTVCTSKSSFIKIRLKLFELFCTYTGTDQKTFPSMKLSGIKIINRIYIDNALHRHIRQMHRKLQHHCNHCNGHQSTSLHVYC